MGFLHNEAADDTGRKLDKPGDVEKSIKARKLSVAQEELIDHIKKKKIGNVLVKNKTDTEAKKHSNTTYLMCLLFFYYSNVFLLLFSLFHIKILYKHVILDAKHSHWKFI